MTFGALLPFNRYNVLIFATRKITYAQPLIATLNASNKDAMIAPHREICSMNVFIKSLINSNMKLNEVLLQSMVTQLLQLCKSELMLSQLPKVELVYTPTVGSDSSFGVFDGSIKVVCLNRHPIDVMRTISHEVVHWKQKEIGAEMDGSDGSETENQANALAGTIMRKFGKMHPEYFLETY